MSETITISTGQMIVAADEHSALLRCEEALREALELVEQGEFLLDRAYSYGDGRTEPMEWGVCVEYQQSRDAGPRAQFLAEVAGHHGTNRDEDDDGGEFLTTANKIRAALTLLDEVRNG